MSRPPRPTGPQPQTEERRNNTRVSRPRHEGTGDRRTRTDMPTPRPPSKQRGQRRTAAAALIAPSSDKQGGAMSGTRRNRTRPPRDRDGRSKQTDDRDGERTRRDGTGHDTSKAEGRQDAGRARDEPSREDETQWGQEAESRHLRSEARHLTDGMTRPQPENERMTAARYAHAIAKAGA